MHGKAKNGQYVYIERPGLADFPALMEQCTGDELLRCVTSRARPVTRRARCDAGSVSFDTPLTSEYYLAARSMVMMPDVIMVAVAGGGGDGGL